MAGSEDGWRDGVDSYEAVVQSEQAVGWLR